MSAVLFGPITRPYWQSRAGWKYWLSVENVWIKVHSSMKTKTKWNKIVNENFVLPKHRVLSFFENFFLGFLTFGNIYMCTILYSMLSFVYNLGKFDGIQSLQFCRCLKRFNNISKILSWFLTVSNTFLWMYQLWYII